MECKNKRFFHAYFSDNNVTKTAQKRELDTYSNPQKSLYKWLTPSDNKGSGFCSILQ